MATEEEAVEVALETVVSEDDVETIESIQQFMQQNSSTSSEEIETVDEPLEKLNGATEDDAQNANDVYRFTDTEEPIIRPLSRASNRGCLEDAESQIERPPTEFLNDEFHEERLNLTEILGDDDEKRRKRRREKRRRKKGAAPDVWVVKPKTPENDDEDPKPNPMSITMKMIFEKRVKVEAGEDEPWIDDKNLHCLLKKRPRSEKVPVRRLKSLSDETNRALLGGRLRLPSKCSLCHWKPDKNKKAAWNAVFKHLRDVHQLNWLQYQRMKKREEWTDGQICFCPLCKEEFENEHDLERHGARFHSIKNLK